MSREFSDDLKDGFIYQRFDGSPMLCKELDGGIWIHYLHPDKKWVTEQPITEVEAVHAFERRLSFEEESQLPQFKFQNHE